MNTTISTESAPAALGPYSQAILANGILYTSGQIGLVPATGEFAGADIESQTRQVLANLGAVLAAANTTPTNVVKTTIFLANMGNFALVNKLYGEFFKAPFPARSCVQATQLPKGALIEIECIAVL